MMFFGFDRALWEYGVILLYPTHPALPKLRRYEIGLASQKVQLHVDKGSFFEQPAIA